MRRVACAFVLTAAGIASGAAPTLTSVTWKGTDGVYDGVITDAAHWVDGVLPGALKQASFSQNASYTVTLPAAGYDTLSSFIFDAVPNRTFTLDARGSYLRQTAAETDNYGAQPFFVKADSVSFARIETLAGATQYTAAQSLVSNTVMTVKSMTAEETVNYPRFSVEGGVFNLFDPAGTLPAITNDFRIFIADAFPAGLMAFKDAETRLPHVVFHGNQTGTSELRFDGGTALVGGRVKFYDARHIPGTTNLLHITGGAKITLGDGFYLDSTKTGIDTRMKTVHKVAVDGAGSEFTANAGFSYGGTWDSSFVLDVRDGGKANLMGGNWSFANAQAIGTPCATATALIHVVNGTLKVGSVTAPCSTFTLGQGPAAYAELRVEGDDARFDLYASAHQYLGYSTAGSVGVMNILGGETTFHELQGHRVYVAGGVGVTGVVNVTGGKLTVEGGYGIGIQSGTGFINISGGEVRADKMPICSENAVAGESVVRLTGGTTVIKAYTGTTKSTNMDGVQITTNGKTNRKARLALDGGVLEANYVVGGSSALVNGGTGYAAFEADGGTLKANAAAPYLLETFDEAKLGAKGLTISSDYAATIRQEFTDKTGEAGRLVLTGIGVKTLSGTSTVSEIAVAGGTASFSAAACPRSRVVVTNGATVNFNGGAGGNLTGLTIGDETTAGYLTVTNGETFAVSGDVEIAKVRFVLSAAFEKGTPYTLLTATGTVSAASAQAWQEGMVASGLAAGLACDFTVETSAGTTYFKMTTRDALDLTIRVDEGVSNVNDAVTFAVGDTLRLIVASNATLNLNGTVKWGSISKEGAGAAHLTNAGNSTAGRINVFSGLLAGTSVGAFGWFDSVSPGMLTLADGTLGLSDPTPDAYFPWTVTPATTASNGAYVIKTGSDMVLAPPATGRGCLIKRGAGRLTFSPASGTVVFSANAGKNVQNLTVTATTVTFDSNGTPPSNNYAGLNIAEGELRLAGGATYQTASGSNPGVTYVGLPVKGISAEPGLVVDGTTANLSSQDGRHFHFACGITDANSDVRHPYVCVTNGATLNVTSFQTGWNSSGSVAPLVRVDNSTLYISEYLYVLRGGTEGAEPTYRFTNGSKLLIKNDGMHGVQFTGKDATLEFDASLYACNTSLERARVHMNGANGKMVFKNGSVMYVNSFVFTDALRTLTLEFDGGEWNPAAGNYTLAATNSACLVFKPRAGGMFLNPPADATWTVSVATFQAGEGAVTHRGAGTVSFAGGVLSNGVAFAGSGTLSGIFPSPVLNVALGENGASTESFLFADATFSGTTQVDFGRTAENPLVPPYPRNVVVARYSGPQPDVGGWKIRGTGSTKLQGAFRAANGEVLVNVLPPSGTAVLLK
ncbi:MAG: hypothetical protein PHV28_04495 [Kiritimatiellae bacterium]|nr:hypothetical protein [Kiritimatiellia bacterium]